MLKETLILYEEFVDFRQVFTDGRALPKDPEPAWFGYSIGRWENGAFVVDTRGYNDKSWLDDDGHPHSEDLRVTERFRRPDFGHLEIEKTLEDPKALAAKWVIPVKLEEALDRRWKPSLPGAVTVLPVAVRLITERPVADADTPFTVDWVTVLPVSVAIRLDVPEVLRDIPVNPGVVIAFPLTARVNVDPPPAAAEMPLLADDTT